MPNTGVEKPNTGIQMPNAGFSILNFIKQLLAFKKIKTLLLPGIENTKKAAF